MAFEVRVPTGGSSGGGDGGGLGQTNKLLKKLDKSILGTVDIIEFLSRTLGDVFKLFSPLVKVLSALFLIIFLPLMPLIMLLVKGIVGLIKIFKGDKGDLAKFIGKLIGGILLAALAVVLAAISAPIWLIVAVLVGAGILLGDALGALIDWIINIGVFLWDGMLLVFNIWGDAFLLGIKLIEFSFQWVSKAVQDGWAWVKNIGPTILGWLKAGFNFIIEALKGAANAIINLMNRLPGVDIPRLAKGGIVTKPTLAVIGEAGPEAVVPLGKGKGMGTNITINNPTFRSESDIRKLAEEIGRKLQLSAKRGFS